MNRNVLFICILTVCAAAVSAATAIIVDSGNFLLHFVNTMFYIALPLIVIGGFLFLIERGFFNVTRYAFRKLFKSSNSKIDSLIEEDKQEEDPRDVLYRTYSFRWTYPMLLTGISLAILSTTISFAVLV